MLEFEKSQNLFLSLVFKLFAWNGLLGSFYSKALGLICLLGFGVGLIVPNSHLSFEPFMEVDPILIRVYL